MELKILYEDNHIIAAEKPCGVLSQGDASGEPSMLDHVKEYIKGRYHKPGAVFLGLLHRLDRQVSGAMIFARTSKAASRLFHEFYGRRVLKLYCALVHAQSGADFHELSGTGGWREVRQMMVRRGDMTFPADEKGGEPMECALEYTLIAAKGDRAVLLVNLITGKKHQIRAQLSSLHMPIEGDTKYGAPSALPGGAIALHSTFIRITHPVKKGPVEIYSAPPEVILSHLPPGFDLREFIRQRVSPSSGG